MSIAVGDRLDNTCPDICISDSCTCGITCQQSNGMAGNRIGTITIVAVERPDWRLQSMQMQARQAKVHEHFGHGSRRTH